MGSLTAAEPSAPSPRGRALAGPAAALVVLWLAALPLVGAYANPDGPAYAAVAERWLAGDLPAAINAYWGPLLSWAAVPLLAVGVEPLFALRLVLLVGAIVTLPALARLLRAAGTATSTTRLLLVAAVPILVYQASFGLYADVLMNAALLWALALALDAEPPPAGRAAAVGALLGLAVLARAYALPVAAVAVAALTVTWWWTGGDRPRRFLGSAAAVVGGLALVVLPWFATLTVVYEEPTWSSSAAFNAELVSPGSAGNPFNVPGLYEPVRDDGMSAWEEPSELPVPRTDAAERGEVDPDDASARAELLVGNARIIVGSLLRRGAPLVALAGLAVVVLAWQRRPVSAVVVPVAVGAAAALGLLPIIAIERYLWPTLLACIPAAGWALTWLRGHDRRIEVAAAGLTVLLVTVGAVGGLAGRVAEHTDVVVASDPAAELVADGRVATLDQWQQTHHLCFRAGCTYLGRPEPGTAAAVADELTAADVDWLLVWPGDEDLADGLPEPDDGTILTIYAVDDGQLVPTSAIADGSLGPTATGRIVLTAQ